MVEIKKTVRDRVGAKASNAPVAHGVGRRKSSVARVWCYRGNGDLLVNGKEVGAYFDTLASRSAATLSLVTVPHLAKHYEIKVNVQGGGLCSQADAVKLGIARALVSMHEDARAALREQKLLTSDDRLKERKKPGQRAARAKFQFVKR